MWQLETPDENWRRLAKEIQEISPLDDENWRRLAKETQYNVSSIFDCDWFLFKERERKYLEQKVGLVVYENVINNDDQKATVMKLSDLIIKEGNRGQCLSDEICMSFIYIVCRGKFEVSRYPVFKVPKSKDNNDACFIDIEGRIYASWQDFLTNNKIPPCEYCYPTNGAYYGDEKNGVVIEFDQSPASKSSKSEITQYAISAALIAYDILIHKKSINLMGNLPLWFSIGERLIVPALTAARNFGTFEIGMSGQKECTGRALTSLEKGNCAFNAFDILKTLIICKNKHKNCELSCVDIACFRASVLFAHAVINIETAKSIIINTPENVIQECRIIRRSNRVLKSTNGKGTIHGNARVTKSLRYINNADEFFSSLLQMGKQSCPTQSKVTFAVGGGIHVSENLRINHSRPVKMSPTKRIQILNATKISDSEISKKEWEKMTGIVLKSLVPICGTTKKETGKQEQSRVSKFISSLTQQLKQSLSTVLQNFADDLHVPILKVAYNCMMFSGMDSQMHYFQNVSILCGIMKRIALFCNNSSYEATSECSNYSTIQEIKFAFRNFTENPHKLNVIFEHIKSLYDIYTMNVHTNISLQLTDIAELADVLLVVDTPLWLRVLTIAEKTCIFLNVSKAAMMLAVVKSLCLYLRQSAHEYVNTTTHCSDNDLFEYQISRIKEMLCNEYSNDLDNLSEDDEAMNSFINEIEDQFFFNIL